MSCRCRRSRSFLPRASQSSGAVDQFILPIPADAGNADDFAGKDVEIDGTQTPDAHSVPGDEPARAKQKLSGRTRMGFNFRRLERLADHRSREFG